MRSGPLTVCVCALVAFTALGSACAPHAGVSPPAILPLTTMRLYETGVGYFERSGTLTPGERTALPVPASHLDDALASLVVLGGGSGESADPVRALSFVSSLSRGMARAMAGLPAADGPIGYLDLLTSLKGAHVAISRSGAAPLVGRIIDVENRDDARALALVVVTDQHELLRVPASALASIRPTDDAYAARLDAALDALSTHAAQSPRLLDLLGASRGPVTLGYVAETPVWRTTYRVVLAAGGHPSVLQAWALVHNDTDEDWSGVKVDLVNGRPDSFLFPLAAPRYARRELVHPDDELSTVPQLLADTADTIWGDNVGEASGAGGVGLSGIGEGGGGSGSGVGLGRLGTIGHGSGVGGTNLLDVGDLAKVDAATGTEAGALFVYGLPDRLALHAHASALVPFLDQAIDAEPITWVDPDGGAPRTAVRFVNSTPQTLPAGTVTFYAGGGFAGEAGLDRLKPGEKRFVRFGADLDVTVTAIPTAPAAGARPAGDAVQRLTYTPGHLVEHFLRTSSTTYALENRGGQARAVYLALRIGANARVSGADATDYDAASSTPAAVVHLDAKARVERTLLTVEGLSRDRPLASLTAADLALALASPELAAPDKAAATDALARERELEETRRAAKEASGELDAVEKELARLREDMKALGGERGAGAPPAFVQRLLSAEQRHDALRKTIEHLDDETKARAERVEAALAKLAR